MKPARRAPQMHLNVIAQAAAGVGGGMIVNCKSQITPGWGLLVEE